MHTVWRRWAASRSRPLTLPGSFGTTMSPWSGVSAASGLTDRPSRRNRCCCCCRFCSGPPSTSTLVMSRPLHGCVVKIMHISSCLSVKGRPLVGQIPHRKFDSVVVSIECSPGYVGSHAHPLVDVGALAGSELSKTRLNIRHLPSR